MIDKYIEYVSIGTIKILSDQVLSVGSNIFITTETQLTSTNLDTGAAFAIGADYYLYLCEVSGNAAYKISLNSTFPTGFTAENSRKIGGFHYGKNRVVNAALVPVNAAGVAKGSGWESNIFDGILPRSIWTLKHRPTCNPEGMVYIGSGVWADIYQASDDGAGGLRSAHNAIPMTGTEGMNWLDFEGRLFVSGKRKLSYDEWMKAAYGSPQGADDNVNAWTKSNNAARTNTGSVDRAVSSIGCRDCVGNVWEWLSNLLYKNIGDYTAASTFAWRDVLGTGNGNAYLQGTNGQSLVALIAGGLWSYGTSAGPRTLNANYYPWNASSGIGVRGACDAL